MDQTKFTRIKRKVKRPIYLMLGYNGVIYPDYRLPVGVEVDLKLGIWSYRGSVYEFGEDRVISGRELHNRRPHLPIGAFDFAKLRDIKRMVAIVQDLSRGRTVTL